MTTRSFFRISRSIAIGSLLLTASPKLASGAVLAGWEVSGLTSFGPSSLEAAAQGDGLIVGSLEKGAGITYNSTVAANWSDAFGGNNFITANDNSKALAISNGFFINFTVTVDWATSASFSSIDANFRRTNAGPNTFQWQYSLNGGAYADIGSTSTYILTGGATAQPSVSLTDISALQTLTTGDAVTFRLLAWRDGGNFNGGSWAIANLTGNDLVLNGTVAVPEPGTTALLGVSAVAAGLAIRRRRKAQTA